MLCSLAKAIKKLLCFKALLLLINKWVQHYFNVYVVKSQFEGIKVPEFPHVVCAEPSDIYYGFIFFVSQDYWKWN